MIPDPDTAAMAQAVERRLAHSPLVEVRTFWPVRDVRGKYSESRWATADTVAAVVAWAAGRNRAGFNVYTTINVVTTQPADVKRGKRMKPGEACDGHVAGRAVIPIDVDYPREAETSATDEQIGEARDLVDLIHADLMDHGWGEAAEVRDTGNGGVLEYLCEPGVPAKQVSDLLHALARRYAQPLGEDKKPLPGAAVDATVSNPSRVLRLAGTVNHKGIGHEGTDKYAPRMCRVLATAGDPVTVTAAMVAEVIAACPPPPRPSSPAPPPPSSNGASRTAGGADPVHRCRQYLRPVPGGVMGSFGSRPCMWAARVCRWGFDLSEEDCWPLMREYSERCTPPWSEAEIAHKLKQANERGSYDKPRGHLLNAPPPPGPTIHWNGKPMGDTRTAAGVGSRNGRPAGDWADGPATTRPPRVDIPPYEPFPVNALPDGLRQFVRDQALALNCDPVFVAIHALGLAGAAAGNALEIRLKRGFEQPPLIWACMVADSGTGKSPGLRPVLKTATALNKRLLAKFLGEVAEFKRAMEEWENGDEAERGERPKPPVEKTFCIEDITVEELVTTASDSAHGLLMVHDEMTALFAMFTRYKGAAGGSDVGKYLKAYDAGWTDYRRKTNRQRVTCERTFLAICGGIQPAVLKAHLTDHGEAHIHSGLAARFLLAWPPKHCLRWTDREPDPGYERRFRDIVYALADLPLDEDGGPRAVRPSPAAKNRYAARYDLNAEQAEHHDGGPMAAALPKASGQAARLALIHHAVAETAAGRDPAAAEVSDESMAHGIVLAEWFVHEAGRVYAMLRESDEDRKDRSLDALLHRLIAKKRKKNPAADSVTVRDLLRANRPGCKTAAAAEAALDSLVTAGRWRSEDRVAGNGVPVRHFTPVPLDTSPDDDPDDDEDTVSDGQEGSPADTAG